MTCSKIAEPQSNWIGLSASSQISNITMQRHSKDLFKSEGNSNMTNDNSELAGLQQQAKTPQIIVEAITHQFAAEDEGLQRTLPAPRQARIPTIQISPTQ